MRTLLATLTLLLASAGLLAADDPIKFKPFEDTAADSELFPEIQAEARRLNHLVRDAIIAPTRESIADAFPKDRVHAFGKLVREKAGDRMSADSFPALPGQLRNFEVTLAGWAKAADLLPTFAVSRSVGQADTVLYTFTGDEDNQGQFTITSNEDIVIRVAAKDVPTKRESALISLQDAIYPYQRNANAYTAAKAGHQLQDLADDWDAYFEKGRPQTFWDITVTTLFEYKHFKTDHLVGPPDRQWFLLHPNAVIENLQAAPDGDQLGGAVAIEWIGVNWWKLKVPLGISLSSLYSDRPGVDDVGHGVTLYIDNKYCIGWASHGGDNGFFVSLDALKLIDSKKGKIDDYRKQITKYFGK